MYCLSLEETYRVRKLVTEPSFKIIEIGFKKGYFGYQNLFKSNSMKGKEISFKRTNALAYQVTVKNKNQLIEFQ